ncbi:tetratricopeptide repeat protein [Paenactinomyces guangxiensis]|uniref:Tetratricopeptide repeat protein n=1 Tax=Paenactinomyces guangxiensis TaxID=1490290 RepID=A0A7W2A936_9BACL|nr:tetratricopeptide repeat protein [Paenactinomyces guangxiensis]MBA4494493.1 tetratricopeptide repeat protein [Paenactinomyces guangxiensis]MBH8591452.1 tetratricopeptide repeat protein [Paenactinomyces guangxiensis]
MFHQQWLQLVQNALDEIKSQYPHCPAAERAKWRNRLQQIKKSCDHMLESWAFIEEQIAHLLSEHPDLVSDEKELEEEFWLNESVVRQFRQGQGYYGLTMFKEAKHLFQQVVEEEPEFLLGRVYLGLSQFQENHLDEARHHFHIVSETASHDVFIGFAHHMLGCIAVKQGEDRRAIKQFGKVVALLPDHSDAWFNLGACHYRLEEYHEAIPYFYHALSLNEDDWESMYYLSSCYRHYQEWGSVSFWRFASYEKTNHPRVIESIAHDYEEMGQPELAIHWYQRLLDRDSGHSAAYHGIAWNLWVLNQVDQAFLWIKKGLTLFPKNADLLFTYVWMSIATGDTRRAKMAMDMLPADLTKQPLWLAIRSRLSTQMGEFEKATGMAEQLIKQENPSIKAMGYYQKGRTLLEMGKVREAIHHFRQAHQLASQWKDPLFFEGVCHMIEGRPDSTRNCWGQICVPSLIG